MHLFDWWRQAQLQDILFACSADTHRALDRNSWWPAVIVSAFCTFASACSCDAPRYMISIKLPWVIWGEGVYQAMVERSAEHSNLSASQLNSNAIIDRVLPLPHIWSLSKGWTHFLYQATTPTPLFFFAKGNPPESRWNANFFGKYECIYVVWALWSSPVAALSYAIESNQIYELLRALVLGRDGGVGWRWRGRES